MTPDFIESDLVKSERVGEIAVEYARTNNSAEAARPVLLMVRDLIGQFLVTGGSNPMVGTVYRV